MKVKIRNMVGVVFENMQHRLGVNPSIMKMSSIDTTDLKLSYWWGRLKDFAISEVKVIDKERNKLFDKLGTPQMIKEKVPDPENPTKMIEKEEDSGMKIIPQENLEKFNEAWDGLMEEEIEILFQPITLSRLEKAGFKLSGGDAYNLAPFLIDDLEEENKTSSPETPKDKPEIKLRPKK